MKTTVISAVSAAALSLGAVVVLTPAANAGTSIGAMDGTGFGASPNIAKVANSCNRNPNGSRNKYSGIHCPNPSRAGKPGRRRVTKCTPVYKTRVRLIRRGGQVFKKKTRIVIGKYCRGVKPRS